MARLLPLILVLFLQGVLHDHRVYCGSLRDLILGQSTDIAPQFAFLKSSLTFAGFVHISSKREAAF